MDDDEENNLCPYGTPLEPLEEDEIPSKKPIAIEDQVVTDDHGRRRFHGAFTGGFSAGFWNTVGSLEGWKPQSFKSSRSEKAKQQAQKPIDFMDDEDLGEFGIAPQRIQTTDDFTPQGVIDKNVRKRKLQQQSTGPIPGIPVLHQLLIPAKENVAIRLLKKMGWKEGQGIGARQTRKEKKMTSGRNARERYVAKKYGCDLGPLSEQKNQSDDQSEEDDDEDDSDNEEITFAPDDFDPYVCAIKDNTFGLGYKGLDSNLLTGTQRHIDLFGNKFEIMGKNNRKLSIRGQAFGVGALEEEDEDIYAPDDMTKYDFSLEEKKKAKTRKEEKPKEFCIEGFCSAKSNANSSKTIFVVKIPPGFKPRNWAIRKSRFEPLSEQQMQLIKQQDEYKTKGLGRHDLDPQQRGNILNETPTTKTSSISIEEDKDSKTTYLQKINEKYESKTESKIDTTADENNSVISLDEDTRKENEKVQNEAKKITQKINTKLGTFKPFINDEAKQARYEKFVEANLRDDEEIKKFLKSIQPLSMSEWDSELEKKEFLQARNMYKPLTGLMSDRFVSETTILAEKEIEKPALTVDKKNNFERTKITWKPCAQLCKRFNVIEPFGGTLIEEKKEKKPKFSVFDYLEISVNRKDNFVTPVIVPKKTEKPAPIISQKLDENKKEEKINLINANKTSISIECANEKDENSKSTNPNVSASSLDKAEVKQKSRKPKTDLEKKIEETKDKHPSEKKDIFKSIFENSDDEEEEKEEVEGKQEEMNESSSSSVKFVSTDANSSISKDIYATLTTKSATELNILRNTSPPRGIFANLFAKKPHDSVSSSSENYERDSQMKCPAVDNASQSIINPSSSTKTKISEIKSVDPVTISKANKSNNDMDDLQYGPKLPTTRIETASNRNVMENDKNIVSEDSSSDSADSLDKKLLNVLKKSKFDSRKKSKIIEEWVEKSDVKSDNESRKKKKKKKDKKKSKKHKKNKKSKR